MKRRNLLRALLAFPALPLGARAGGPIPIPPPPPPKPKAYSYIGQTFGYGIWISGPIQLVPPIGCKLYVTSADGKVKRELTDRRSRVYPGEKITLVCP